MIGIVCAFFHTEGKGFYSKHIPNMKNMITNAIFLFNLCKVFTEPPLPEINFQ